MPKKIDYGEPTRSSARQAAKSQELSSQEEAPGNVTPCTKESEFSATASPEPEEPAPIPPGTEPVEPASENSNPEPVAPHSDIERDQPVDSIEVEGSEYDSAFEQSENEDPDPSTQASGARPVNAPTTTESHHKAQQQDPRPFETDPSPSTQLIGNMSTSNNNNNDPAAPAVSAADFQALMAEVARLKSQLATQQGTGSTADRSTREITPLNSAFGGSDFKPTGFAAHEEFKPYGVDQTAKNPDYEPKARKSGVDPGTFDGNKEEFDGWITQVADKFEEDNATFRRERSRMAILKSLTKGAAGALLDSRYRSTKIPFKNVSEMVATLEAVYHDAHQGTKAREELRKLKYDPADPNIDIHQFIGKVNSLADKANIPYEDRKTTLYEHIPAYINPQLMEASDDPSISYEAFAKKVSSSALAQQRAYQEKKERKQAKGSTSPPQRRRSSRYEPRYVKKEGQTEKPSREANYRDQDIHKADQKETRTCFICKKEGHLARECPDRKDVARMWKEMEAEEARETDASTTSSSDCGSSDSEN